MNPSKNGKNVGDFIEDAMRPLNGSLDMIRVATGDGGIIIRTVSGIFKLEYMANIPFTVANSSGETGGVQRLSLDTSRDSNVKTAYENRSASLSKVEYIAY